MRNKPKSYKHLPPSPPFFLGLTLFTKPLVHRGWGMGVVVISSHVVSAAPSYTGGGLFTLFPCCSLWTLPREMVLHELFQYEPFYQLLTEAPSCSPLPATKTLPKKPDTAIRMCIFSLLFLLYKVGFRNFLLARDFQWTLSKELCALKMTTNIF